MITRKMNQRITFFSLSGGQNEDGEVLDAVRKDLYTCWTEVLKTQLRDFKLQAS
ncbi:phage head completion protein, partial [Streptococcus uberis]